MLFGASVATQCDQVIQFTEVGGLDQMMIEAGQSGPFEMLFLAVSAVCDQQRSLLFGDQADAARDLIAVHAGQSDIEEHDIRVEFLDMAQGGRTIASRLYVVAIDAQESGTALQS